MSDRADIPNCAPGAIDENGQPLTREQRFANAQAWTLRNHDKTFRKLAEYDRKKEDGQ